MGVIVAIFLSLIGGAVIDNSNPDVHKAVSKLLDK